MQKITEFINKFLETAASIVLTGIVAMVFIASVSRTAGHPIVWSEDIAQLLFAWVCVLGAHQALRFDKHIGVDAIVRYLPLKVQKYIGIMNYLLIMVFLSVITVYGFNLTFTNIERQYNTTTISYSWATVSIPIGCTLMLVTVVSKLINLLKTDLHKKQLSEMVDERAL